jgi:hypothetical protein
MGSAELAEYWKKRAFNPRTLGEKSGDHAVFRQGLFMYTLG